MSQVVDATGRFPRYVCLFFLTLRECGQISPDGLQGLWKAPSLKSFAVLRKPMILDMSERQDLWLKDRPVA